MISKEEFMKIKVLAMQGMSQRAIAKQRNTVKKYLQGDFDEPHYATRKTGGSKLEAFKPYLHSRLALYTYQPLFYSEKLKSKAIQEKYRGNV